MNEYGILGIEFCVAIYEPLNYTSGPGNK